MALVQVEGHLTGRGPFSNGCKVPLQGPHRFWICGINPQLGIVSELRHLAGESEIQVIDIDGKRRGPKTDPWRTPLLTVVQSEGTPLMTPFASFLPTNSQFRQEHWLDAHGSNLPREPFVKDFIKGFSEVQKVYIHCLQTVTLTEHVLDKRQGGL